MNLKDKTVLLTGAARGLGRELADLLACEDCQLILIDREEIRAESYSRARFLRCDLTQAAERDALFAALAGLPVNVMIHCAGVGSHSTLKQLTVSEARRVMTVNALAPLELTSALPGLGLLVSIGSVAGEMSLPSMSLYSAGKSALHAFTRALAAEGLPTLLVMLGPLRGTDFAQSIAHPRAGQPRWYRALDVDAKQAARRIVLAIKSGRRELVLPVWYRFIFWVFRQIRPLLR